MKAVLALLAGLVGGAVGTAWFRRWLADSPSPLEAVYQAHPGGPR